MDTEVLKRTIGAKCLVLDPRSKCCEFKLAKVISANYFINTFARSEEIYEHVSFRVELVELTISKRKQGGEIRKYHRNFVVSENNIHILSDQ